MALLHVGEVTQEPTILGDEVVDRQRDAIEDVVVAAVLRGKMEVLSDLPHDRGADLASITVEIDNAPQFPAREFQLAP